MLGPDRIAELRAEYPEALRLSAERPEDVAGLREPVAFELFPQTRHVETLALVTR